MTYIDSTALAAQDRLRRAGGWLAVAAATEPVTRMFRVAGLTCCITLHATVTDVIAAAQARRPSDA